MRKESVMKACKISLDHLETRVSWLNAEEVYSFMNMKYPITLKETVDWYDRVRINPSRADFSFFDNDKIVAMSGLTSLDLANGLMEYYVMVNPDCQGQGYGVKVSEWTLN